MDSSDIESALNDSLTDFSVSGSEYVPSDELDCSSESDSSNDNDDDEVQEQNRDNSDVVPVDIADDPVHNVVSAIHNDYVMYSTEWTAFKDSCREFPFSAQPGLQYNFDVDDPFCVFKQFVDNEILDLIVDQTNLYAQQYIASKQIKKRSPMANWRNCNKDEIHKLLGVLIIMGICPLPQRQMYWSNNPMYGNPVIKNTMSRDRFDCLMKCLHFQNNEEAVLIEPRLAKIKNLISILNSKFKNVLIPDQSLVIDESMVPWRGRLLFKQYLPGKSHKYGVKIYKVCSTTGYTFKVKVYAGKSDVTAQEGHADKVVFDLLENYLNEGRTLYADNFYTSIRLAASLLSNKTYICGTLRCDRRGNPKKIVTDKISKGEMITQENSKGVKCMKWRDKRDVLMVSTRPEESERLVNTGKRNKQGNFIMKPSSVIAYNKAKKGVDFSDQMSSYYSPLRKTIAWYKKVALELILGTSVVNAFVIHNQFGKGKKMDMLQFREKLISSLIQPNGMGQQQTTPGNRNGSKKPKHELIKREGSVRQNRKRCATCYKEMKDTLGAPTARKLAKRVSTFCNVCEGNPTMCLDCFNKVH